MFNWMRVLSNILPRGRAWKLWPGTQIRAFFSGLIDGLVKPFRDEADRTYLDLFPQSTRALRDWERQWGLSPGTLSEQQRRDRLDAQWKALGGQSPRYIQDTLRGAGFDVYVHEWWKPNTSPPVARNPNNHLDIPGTGFAGVAGADFMVAGNNQAVAGVTFTPVSGYSLVNKITYSGRELIAVAGAGFMVSGNADAVAGRFNGFFLRDKKYTIPQDVDAWPYFLYIGGQSFPDLAQVDQSRRDEFEELMLRICPLQQWLGVLVEYT